MPVLARLKEIGGKIKESFAQSVKTGQFQSAAAAAIPGGAAVNAASKAGGVIKAGATGLKNIFQRATANPLAGVGLKEGLKAFAKKPLGGALGGLGIAGAAFAGQIAAGSSTDIASTVKKSIATGVGAAVNPIAFIASFATGLGERGIGAARAGAGAAIGKARDLDLNYGTAPQISPTYNFAYPDIQVNTSVPAQPFLPGLPSASYAAPSFSPSVQVGGGGSEILPLLLLLAGGGALGYAVGKRRKKKKYKKRKTR